MEIFKPHYANAVATFIVDTIKSRSLYDSFSPSHPLHLCEIGGGNATCCTGVLNFLRDNHPKLYENTIYTSIDVSTSFIRNQRDKVSATGHAEKVKFVNKSIFDYETKLDGFGFVICLELLDNLPHDKLISKFSIANFSEVSVAEEIEVKTPESSEVISPTKTRQVTETQKRDPTNQEPQQKLVEVHGRLSDPVIIDFLDSFCSFYGLPERCFMYETKTFDSHQCAVLWDILCAPYIPQTKEKSFSGFIYEKLKQLRTSVIQKTGHTSTHYSVYIPTGAFMLFKKLHTSFPQHNVICADFTDLRGAMYGLNAPLVQKTEGNETIEQSSYLTAPKGEYDIFFPTNFTLLKAIYHMTTKEPCSSKVLSSKEFMKRYANTKATKTKLGYNPLLDDFTNTAFFLGFKRPTE